MSQRRTLIAGNWKMNKLPSEALSWTREFVSILGERAPLNCDVVVAAPFTHLPGMARLTFGNSLALAAQDVSAHDQGAYTGEISADMLKDTGAAYVVVGHSERRAYHGEDGPLIRAKVQRCMTVGLTPIVCVGESREQRDAGDAKAVVIEQLEGALESLEFANADDLVIAYEPVWAIGTGLTATADDAQEMCAAVREQLGSMTPGLAGDVRILYGGSMKPSNSAELLARPDIDGGLIGGASLTVDDLLAIIESVPVSDALGTA